MIRISGGRDMLGYKVKRSAFHGKVWDNNISFSISLVTSSQLVSPVYRCVLFTSSGTNLQYLKYLRSTKTSEIAWRIVGCLLSNLLNLFVDDIWIQKVEISQWNLDFFSSSSPFSSQSQPLLGLSHLLQFSVISNRFHKIFLNFILPAPTFTTLLHNT